MKTLDINVQAAISTNRQPLSQTGSLIGHQYFTTEGKSCWNGGDEVFEKEKAEIAVIERFLPKQLGEEKTVAAIKEIVAETGAESMKDMGKVMSALRAKYAGQMDFSKASGLIKTILG